MNFATLSKTENSCGYQVLVGEALGWRDRGACRFQEICGFHGVLAGLLVAVKHIAPDTELTLLQVAKLRAKV